MYENLLKCDSMCRGCPFAMTEESEQAQNYGCLPSIATIFNLMKIHNSNWSCHEQDGKMCSGYIAMCRDRNIAFKGKPMFASETWLRTGEEKIMVA